MKAIKAIGLVVCISGLTYGLCFVGWLFNGGGHGSSFFLDLLFAPFTLAARFLVPLAVVIFWPSVALLVALRRVLLCRIAAVAVLGLHSVGAAIVISKTESYYFRKAWQSGPELFVAFVAIYAASQAFMWFLVTKKTEAEPASRANRR